MMFITKQILLSIKLRYKHILLYDYLFCFSHSFNNEEKLNNMYHIFIVVQFEWVKYYSLKQIQLPGIHVLEINTEEINTPSSLAIAGQFLMLYLFASSCRSLVSCADHFSLFIEGCRTFFHIIRHSLSSLFPSNWN